MTQTPEINISNIQHFVDIENKSISPIQIDAWIKTRRNAEKIITPEFALEILKRTNNFANIKVVVKEIQKLPKEKQLEYKDFVLSAVSSRMQTEQTLEALCQLAIDGDYLQEFIDENTNSKIYFSKTCRTKQINNTNPSEQDFSTYDTLVCYSQRVGLLSSTIEKCTLPQYVSFVNLKEINLIDNNYNNSKEINFSSISRINISHQTSILPEELDFSSCQKVRFSFCDLSSIKTLQMPPQTTLSIQGCWNLPQTMLLQNLTTLTIASHFNTTEELIIDKCNQVSLSSSTRVPKNIIIKNCKSVKLEAIDFNIKELNLENIQYISLCKKQFGRSDSKEIPPKTLDLSSCNEIIFQNFPLGKIKELKFGTNHESVDLQYAKSMPKVLDLRGAKKVMLNYANCCGLKEIKFAKGSVVHLTGAYNLPKKLDISMCNCIDMFDCDLTNVEEITFLNEEQKEALIPSNQTFNGKIKYSTSTISPTQNNDFTI